MVDLVTEIPLAGRTICGSRVDAGRRATTVVVPSFVAGNTNRVLATALTRVLPHPEFENSAPCAPAIIAIHGPSGTGKTHLARGVVLAWQSHAGESSAEYLTATDFRHELTSAIKNEAVNALRIRIRHLRLLAIDGLDRLPKDNHLQHELRSTIDELAENGGQLVVASTLTASTLRNLTPDIRSRLAAGLELPIAPLDAAARTRLVHHVSAALGTPLSPPAAVRLAADVEGTAQDLFGTLFELYADRAERGSDDLQWVNRYLAVRAARRPAFRDILHTVAKRYSIPQKTLKSASRRQSTMTARAIVVYLARELATLGYEQIGRALGGRDHTTMMHSYKKIVRLVATDAATRDTVDDLRRELAGQFLSSSAAPL